ncbi:MAG TPA: H-X9-DG-CTERM domain-containing protein [Blastocatellia bacterium]|nr:H-X9-DG-CTERM domain-containing protein [Blastocatellia bacterium]
MKLTGLLKIAFCLALVLCWGSSAPPVTAQGGIWVTVGFFEVVAPAQTVSVHSSGDSFSAVFQNEARLFFPRGEASGFLTLTPTDSAPGHPSGANFTFGDGSVRFLPNGSIARVVLRGRTVEGDPVVVMITPEPSEDCLIYTTIGTDGRATWEAEGRIAVIPN